MPDERRYRDDEVAKIFETAVARRNPGGAALSPAEGLTLAELQAIGGEVGMAPERIAEAAAALDLRGSGSLTTDFGMPVSVRRTVELPRAPTDAEWQMLVADLRETFHARGREGSRAGIREWTNGNLHAYVEPTPTGHRLRLGTTRGGAVPFNRISAAFLVMALVALVLLSLGGELSDGFYIPLIFAAMGGGGFALNALTLRPWAEEREAQMELVAARVCALLATEPASEPIAGELLPGEAV